jgi:hypothetical protein
MLELILQEEYLKMEQNMLKGIFIPVASDIEKIGIDVLRN